MDKLFKGILEFQENDFEEQKALFEQLDRGQKPHTLFIGCADSRVVPALLTKTDPGELFIVRNVANIVPPWGKSAAYAATTSAIEYAVLALDVDTIVVCGHSGCGGCQALHMSPAELEHLPHTRKWLEIIQEIPGRVARKMRGTSEAERDWLTERINVLVQMQNLLTYPYIRERLAAGQLEILGWHYVIRTGQVFNFNQETRRFDLVE